MPMDKDEIKTLLSGFKTSKGGGSFVCYAEEQDNYLLVSKKEGTVARTFKEKKRGDSKIVKGKVLFLKAEKAYVLVPDKASALGLLEKRLKPIKALIPFVKKVLLRSPEELAALEAENESLEASGEEGLEDLEGVESEEEDARPLTAEQVADINEFLTVELDVEEVKTRAEQFKEKLSSLALKDGEDGKGARKQAQESLKSILTAGIDGVNEQMSDIINTLLDKVPEPAPLAEGAEVPDATRLAALAGQFNGMLRAMDTLAKLRVDADARLKTYNASQDKVTTFNAELDAWRRKYDAAAPEGKAALATEGTALDQKAAQLGGENDRNRAEYAKIRAQVEAQIGTFNALKDACEAAARP